LFVVVPRVPILGVLPRSQLHLCLRMDAASDITSSCGQEPAAKVSGDPSPAAADKLGAPERTHDGASDLSRPASGAHADGSTDDAPLDDCVGCLGDAEGSSHELPDNPDPSEPSGKIPNRDSGIDSPSCAAEGEAFPNEDAIDEEDRYDSVTETESASCCVALGNKRDSTQDEDSDLDEGSGGEIHSLADTRTGYLTDAHSEAHKVSSSSSCRRPPPPGRLSTSFSRCIILFTMISSSPVHTASSQTVRRPFKS